MLIVEYTPVFLTAVDILLNNEGGYANNPNDRGGETNFGISKRSYPDLNIKTLTRDKAIAIYFRDFWIPAHCEDVPRKAAIAHLDCAAICGKFWAIRILQRALRVTSDGIIGPESRGALSRADETQLVKDMIHERVLYHARIARDDRTLVQNRNLPGWVLRCGNLQRAIFGGIDP